MKYEASMLGPFSGPSGVLSRGLGFTCNRKDLPFLGFLSIWFLYIAP